ncbi:MAG: DUF192 domain-containing protein [Patescibacteria group bacterium]
MKKTILITIALVLLLSGCFATDWVSGLFSKVKSGKLSTKNITLSVGAEKVPLVVEVADSEGEREQGLMERNQLEDDAGMLFIFEDEQPRQFWMKNTLIPLDIIYFNSKQEVVSMVEHMQPCKVAQCPSYPSKQPATYALEVQDGFISTKGVKRGDTFAENK